MESRDTCVIMQNKRTRFDENRLKLEKYDKTTIIGSVWFSNEVGTLCNSNIT